MDALRFKKWCYFNIILPGMGLVEGNNTTDWGPTCHLPASPRNPLVNWLEEAWPVVLLVTLVIVSVTGVMLAFYHFRWRRALQWQRDQGLISPEDYERLK